MHHHTYMHSLPHPPIHPFIYLLIRSSIHPSIHLSTYLSIHPSCIHPTTHSSIQHPCTHVSIYSSIHTLSIFVSINHLSSHPSIYGPTQQLIHSFIHPCIFTSILKTNLPCAETRNTDMQEVVYPHSEIVFSLKQEGSSVNSMLQHR